MPAGKEKGPILVVIDMQTKFPASRHKRALLNCAREITRAKRAHQRILFVEYADQGPTRQDLTDLVICPCDSISCRQGYDRFGIVKKYGDDGSNAILEYLKEFKRDTGKLSLTVCGVNTDCCIKWTVLGLAQKRKDAKIRVVKDACHQPSDWKRRQPFARMQEAKNVLVI